ncbi:MAG: 50S ribosomal protein L11 methyltransferase, partial [Gammaproteobacteria bacterium]|nr:50S ribosomal protein L11 methyltransferase [Gammaproteobacteria bacterium]
MSYSRITDHRSMVFDGLRNAAYARALQQVVGPTTTVMDLGAGLGVHGLNAASLGAAAVHLVEPAPVIEVARAVAKANGLANVHCHASRVEELQLATQVDVIVSVFTGNFLLTEDLLPSLFYARDRFLAPGGQLIPDRARMEVVPVSAPDYYQKHIDAWNGYPGHAAELGEPELDYSAVRSFAANTLYYDTRENFNATPLAAPATLMEMDFTLATRADCDSAAEVQV